MADDRKRSDNICAKVTEQMFIDVHRMAAMDDLSASAWLYVLIRRELYGRARRADPHTSVADSTEGIPRGNSRGSDE